MMVNKNISTYKLNTYKLKIVSNTFFKSVCQIKIVGFGN